MCVRVLLKGACTPSHLIQTQLRSCFAPLVLTSRSCTTHVGMLMCDNYQLPTRIGIHIEICHMMHGMHVLATASYKRTLLCQPGAFAREVHMTRCALPISDPDLTNNPLYVHHIILEVYKTLLCACYWRSECTCCGCVNVLQ